MELKEMLEGQVNEVQLEKEMNWKEYILSRNDFIFEIAKDELNKGVKELEKHLKRVILKENEEKETVYIDRNPYFVSDKQLKLSLNNGYNSHFYILYFVDKETINDHLENLKIVKSLYGRIGNQHTGISLDSTEEDIRNKIKHNVFDLFKKVYK